MPGLRPWEMVQLTTRELDLVIGSAMLLRDQKKVAALEAAVRRGETPEAAA